MNFAKLESALKFSTVTSKGKNVQSITLTFTESNGKRLTLSNGLLAALNITNRVYIGILVDDRKIILANNPLGGTDEYKVSKGGKVYSARLVSGLIESLGLQPMYESHTSHTFKNIEVDADNGVAVVGITVSTGK